MSAFTRRLAALHFERFIDHLRTPLYRNGYALVFSSAVTSALGLVYWILAARYYTTEVIGLNAAALSAMMFISNLSQLNLMNALNRFVPTAGRTTARLVGSAYIISALVAGAASLIFVLGVRVWTPTLEAFVSGFGGWFVVATAMWCIFVLQDSALTGLRQTTWVPIENLVFAIGKAILLVALAAALPRYGVLASWIIPLIAISVPLNWLIFRHLIPRHVQTTAQVAAPGGWRQIARYVAGDYVSSLAWIATVNVMPLVVVEQLGATANAYFYLSWTVAYTLYLISRNMGMSLIAEAALEPDRLYAYSYRVLIQTARLLVPIVTVLVMGAPLILQIFGRNYAADSTTLLRLLSLSALPQMVIALYLSIARVQRRMMAIVVVQGAQCALVIGLGSWLLERSGLDGLGWAWLIAQTSVAVVLLFTELRAAWLVNLPLGNLWRVLAAPRRWWQARDNHRRAAEATELMRTVASTIALTTEPDPTTTWNVQDLIGSLNDMTVANLGPIDQPPTAILKLAHSERAAMNLKTQVKVLTRLRADSRLDGLTALMPAILTSGEAADRFYLIERHLPGIDGRHLLGNVTLRTCLQAAAANTIAQLHRATASTAFVNDDLLTRWIDRPLQAIRPVAIRHDRAGEGARALDRLAAELKSSLMGRRVSVSWIHGDYMPGNILATADGARLTGIVDWDLAAAGELPQLDLMHFLLSMRMLVENREMGDVVRELLTREKWTTQELDILIEAQAALPGEVVETRTLILLSWLRHIARNLTKSDRYAGNWLWLTKNVEGVLHHI
ncbi:MAG: phosphotransferase [Chloroflexi bacterium]|nr:phosphotransferase [Chloroflexota bacterium]